MSEHEEQVALFRWAALNETKYPALRNLFAIPNGGLRNKFVAVKLKREGVKPGVPDTMFAHPSGGHNGLFIEMKFGKNKPSPNQREWIERLTKANYKCIVCYGWEEARDEILNYLGEKSCSTR